MFGILPAISSSTMARTTAFTSGSAITLTS